MGRQEGFPALLIISFFLSFFLMRVGLDKVEETANFKEIRLLADKKKAT